MDSVGDRAAQMLTSGRKVIGSKAPAIKSRGICHRSEEKSLESMCAALMINRMVRGYPIEIVDRMYSASVHEDGE